MLGNLEQNFEIFVRIFGPESQNFPFCQLYYPGSYGILYVFPDYTASVSNHLRSDQVTRSSSSS